MEGEAKLLTPEDLEIPPVKYECKFKVLLFLELYAILINGMNNI